MVCLINKWKISQALDTGKNLSPKVTAHLERCTTCRNFAAMSGSLERRLNHDREDFLKHKPDHLEERIINSLDKKNNLVQLPPRRTIKRLPAMAAGLALLALTLTIVFQFTPAPKATTDISLTHISQQLASKKPLQDIFSKVESPMEKEMRGLGKTIQSAADYLISRLDFKIGQS